MIVLLDASTLINLANGGMLASVLSLPDIEFHVSSFVRDESSSIAALVDQALNSGHLLPARDDQISADEFRARKAATGLGSGETECILIAEKSGCAMACDDGRARKKALQVLGSDERVIGSIGLLKMACESGVITSEQACDAVDLMRRCGGYLPAVESEFFGRLDRLGTQA